MAKRKKETVTDLLYQVILVASLIFAGIAYVNTNSFGVAFFVWLLIIMPTYVINILLKAMISDKLRRSGIHEVDKMTGVQFEEFLKVLYKGKGYTVKGTPKSGDFGADLLLEKQNIRIVVQAKRYKNNVGIKAVQEALSAKPYYDADEAWVVTNSFYTDAAKKLALKANVKMISRNELIEMMVKQQAKKRIV